MLGVARYHTKVRELIRRLSRSNPLRGAPRIHGELLKLGIGTSSKCRPSHSVSFSCFECCIMIEGECSTSM